MISLVEIKNDEEQYNVTIPPLHKPIRKLKLKKACDDMAEQLPINCTLKTRGTGAGGANTNRNGLSYEEMTDLTSEYMCHKIIDSKPKTAELSFHAYPQNMFVTTRQAGLFKYMKDAIDTTVDKAHGCKNPDECYIHIETNTIIIIEKKFQQVSGSVCEKIQTADFKRRHYKRSFPGHKIVYIYCLSDWFKLNCKAELEYLSEINIPVFWGNSNTYKKDIVEYIVSCI